LNFIYFIQFNFTSLHKKIENLNKHHWSLFEDYVFFHFHKTFGNKWSALKLFLWDRSDNNLKNNFYSNLRKTLRRYIKNNIRFSILNIFFLYFFFTLSYFNLDDMKEKLKGYYSLNYIRDKIIEKENWSKNLIDLEEVNLKQIINK
jgi:hypothetical protein